MRNAVVHEGREPAWHRVDVAFGAFDLLRGFVVERLLNDPWRHRRTLLALEGPDGLLAAGAGQDRFRSWLERALQEPEPWWLPHDAAGRDPAQ